jgi:hypothetical protein
LPLSLLISVLCGIVVGPELAHHRLLLLRITRHEEVLDVIPIVASFFRDELPWLYEMGVEVYRQSLTAKPTAVRRAYGNFIEAAHMASMGPFSHELRSERMRMLLDEMPMLLKGF